MTLVSTNNNSQKQAARVGGNQMEDLQLSFTLPTRLSQKNGNLSAPSAAIISDNLFNLDSIQITKLSKQVSGISLRQTRPSMLKSRSGASSETAENTIERAKMIAKLSTQFEARLKICENTSKTVERNIELKRRNKQKEQVNGVIGGVNQRRSTLASQIEKIRQKERQAVSSALQQHELEKARRKKIQIESMIPAQRRQYIKNLELQVMQKQQIQNENYKRKEQELQVKLAREKQIRDMQIAAERARKEAEALALREAEEQRRLAAEEEARRKAEKEAKQKAQAEQEALRKAQEEEQRKQMAEAQKQKDEESKKQAQQQQQEEQKVQQSVADQNIPDLGPSLLPEQARQNRPKKTYLQPCAELVAQMQQTVAAWKKFEVDMIKYKKTDIMLDKDFFQYYPNGDKEKIEKVTGAITRVSNTINRPDPNNPPEVQDAELQSYADTIIQRMLALNTEFSHNPDVLRYAIYTLVVTGFAMNKFKSAAQQKDSKVRQEILIDYYMRLYDKLHFQLPQLCLKEIVMGFIASRNMLFYPMNAQMSDVGNDEIKMIEQRGYRVVGGKREGISETLGRLQIHSAIFFALHISDAYIGRLFLMLSTLLSLKYTQLQAYVIMSLLDIGGHKLFEKYGRAYVDQLQILKNEFCPNFRHYIDNGMEQEPQNKAQYLRDEDKGITEIRLKLNELDKNVDEQLQYCQNGGGQRGIS